MCCPSRGAGFSAAIGSPSSMIGVRTPGIEPSFAASLLRIDLHAAMLHLRVLEHLIEIVDRPGRHADRFELLQQIVALEFLRQPREVIDQLPRLFSRSLLTR